MNTPFKWNFLPLLLLIAASASANEGLSQPLPGGIVFPGFSWALLVNPAGITVDDVVVVQGLYSPLILGSSYSGIGGGVDAGFKSVGLGAKLSQPLNSGSGQPGWVAGGGFKIQDFSFGIAGGSTSGVFNYGYANSPGLAIGMIKQGGSGSGTSFAAVLNSLSGGGSPHLSLGIGYGERRKYNLEANLHLPPFSNLGSSGAVYGISVGLAAYAGMFGASYVPTLSLSTGSGNSSSFSSFSHRVAVMLQPFRASFFSLEYDSGSRTTLGFNWVL